MTEYRIDYTISRRGPGDDDFEEIGFGSSAPSIDINSAAYMVESDIQNRQWETGPDHPDPGEVDRDRTLEVDGG